MEKEIYKRLLEQLKGAEDAEIINLDKDTAPIYKQMAMEHCERDGCFTYHQGHNPRCTRHFLPTIRKELEDLTNTDVCPTCKGKGRVYLANS